MATEVGQAYIPVKPDLSEFGRDVSSGLGGQEKTVAGIGKKIGLAFAGGLAITKGIGIGRDAIAAFDESRKVAAQTAAVIKSTGGAAGVTEKDIGNLAGSLSKMSGVDDELIQSGANVLATFTNVRNEVGKGNDIFSQATSIGLDMSVALGQDMKSSAIQLGKALNDPIKGVSALQRVGVTFTDQQKAQIKTMVEAGDTAGAQKVILAELSKEFGGSAKAQATAGDKLRVTMGNLSESLGQVLAPVLDHVASSLAGVADWFTHLNPGVKIAAGVVAALAGGAFVLVKAMKAWEAITHAVEIAQGILNAVMAANPIFLIAAALAALVVGLVLAYQHSETFRAIVQAAFGAVSAAADAVWQAIKAAMDFIVGAFKGVVDWLGNNWDVVLTILTGPIGGVILLWRRFGDDIVGFFKGVPNAIGSVMSGLGDVLTAPFRIAFNAIATIWNNTVGKLSFKVPSWVPGIGGKGWDVPDLPLWNAGSSSDTLLNLTGHAFASGGVVTRPTVGLLGEVARARPEIVTPERLMRDIVRQESGGGGFNLHGDIIVNNNGAPLDGVNDIGRILRKQAFLLGAV